jgi:hypothetical protein
MHPHRQYQPTAVTEWRVTDKFDFQQSTVGTRNLERSSSLPVQLSEYPYKLCRLKGFVMTQVRAHIQREIKALRLCFILRIDHI